MNQPLRIVVADDEPDMRDYFRKILPRLGHQVVGAAKSGRELTELCLALHPDLVITDIKMPDLDGIDAAMEIYQHLPVPVILVSAYHDALLVERAEADHIMGYLVKPIKQADLGPTIALTMHRFEQFQELSREATDLRQALQDRKVIERAKGLLMKRDNVSEQEAYTHLQKIAMSQRRKLVEVAQEMTADKDHPLKPPKKT
jgi:response regulator NasT